ncbi:MAG: hydantoinase B/oxoprolinase family protein [Burkholderiaceae bacterium]
MHDPHASGRDDPVLLAIVQKQLDHITRQMGWIMTRTARSPMASESHDFSCFIGTADGEVAAQADGLPIHSGGGRIALQAVLAAMRDDIADGDVFLMNDPYVAGGNHLPDYTVVRPVFVDGRLCGFVGNRAHQSDIGGGAAGTYNPAATEIFHEGIRLPVLKLIERGTLRRDVWQLLLINTRCPDLMEGDLGAMLGSTQGGAERFSALLHDLGPTRGLALMEQVLDYGERSMRAAIAALPDGTWYGEEISDSDCFTDVEVPVRVRLTVSGDSLNFDFTGSSPQIRGFKNSSLANTCSAVYAAVAAFFDAGMVRNSGTFRPVSIVAPEGSIVNPRPPAPMTMNTVFQAADIIHACWKALAGADPDRACAGWGKSVYGISTGLRDDGRTFVMYHWHASSGTGAVRGRDGFPQAGNLPTLGARTLPNVETYERFYPCRIHRQEFRCDAAGPGEYRGGCSADYEAEVLVDSVHTLRAEGLRRPGGYGVAGGGYGAKGSNTVQERGGEPVPVPQYGIQHLGPMTVRIQGSAGGGWGHPMARETAKVLRDVRDGIVSPAAARAVYGVAISADGRSVDAEQTQRLRSTNA